MQDSTGRKLLFFLLPLLVVAILYLVYSPALNGPFLLDDYVNIPQTQVDRLSTENVLYVATSNTSGIFGRPIPALSFMLNYLYTGDSTFGFKITNWVIHLINSLLVFCLVWQISNCLQNSNRRDSGVSDSKFLAIFIALIWAIHPLQVSTVMYVVQRMTQLSVLFTLLALASYMYGRVRLGVQNRGFAAMSLGVLVFGLLACLSKENGVLIPVYILLVEYTIFQFKAGNHAAQKSYRIFMGLFVVLPLAVGITVLALYFDKFTMGYDAIDSEFTLVQRLLTEPGIVLGYLQVIVVPNIDHMSLYQDDQLIESSLSGGVMLNIGLIVVLLLSVVILRKRLPFWSLGIGLFFLAHSIESTFLPLKLAFEHRNYLAVLGVAMCVVSLASLVAQKWKLNKAAVALGAVVSLGLGAQTFSRSTEWQDAPTMNAIAIENYPASYSARTWYAVSLSTAGYPDLAVEQFKAAKKIKPDRAYPMLAIVQSRCLVDEYYESDFSAALEEMGSDLIDITTAQTLGDLTQNIQSGLCANLNSSRLQQLYAEAYNSERVSLPLFAATVFGGNYASLLSTNGHRKEARDVLKNLAESDPLNPELLLRLTSANIVLADHSAAVENLARIKKLGAGVLIGNTSRINALEARIIELTRTRSELSEEN